jgi:hypothetical protein
MVAAGFSLRRTGWKACATKPLIGKTLVNRSLFF